MVRFNMRSLAFMAFAVFAAASPVAESVNHPAAAVLPAAPAPVGGVALPQVPQEQFVRDERNVVQAVPVMQGMMVPQQGADSKVSQQAASQACRMVPCSESECMKYLNPEEQKEFKRQCEQMKLEQMKTAKAKGQSRIAQGNFELTFYRMIPNQQANASGVATNGNTAVTATGGRPNGKNLCCCCCPCCCCCCPCCCCCKCCCCKCCCCCCPCCCHCCCC